MVNRIVSVHAGICGIGIYAIMLPSSGFSVAHCAVCLLRQNAMNGVCQPDQLTSNQIHSAIVGDLFVLFV